MGAYSAPPDSLAGFKGPYFYGEGKKGRGGGEGMGIEGKGGEGIEEGNGLALSIPTFYFMAPPMVSNFSQLDGHTILVFPPETLWQYSDGTPPPPERGIECRRV